ncbi:MAG: hypothetical protein JNM22_18855 [Saprospiraceae bacterium]|nr:hypothetical protein [Saprospiraceae bacterium]
MKRTSIFCCILVLLAACKNDRKQPEQTPQPTETVSTDTRPAVFLEGVYATSTQAGSDAAFLFDSENSNFWQTKPGAGPDEGLMLYFRNPVQLSALQLQAEGNSFAPAPAASAMQVYVNGTALPATGPGQRVQIGNTPVKSLYLRFNSTGKEKEVDIVKNDVKTTISQFPADASIRVLGLQCWDDKGQELRLVAPEQISGKISASSTLAPASAFGSANLFDSRKEFAWVEGNATSSGENETLRFEFDRDVHITALEIWNGYQRSAEHFQANARVRDFSFGVPGGLTHTYTLRDTKAGQKIDLSAAASGKTFELKISSIYPGRTYKDLAISDILFYDGDRAFTMKTGFSENLSQTTRTRAQGSPLAGILDRRISNETDDAEIITQSLILRSDGTFVMYSVTEETGDQILADGNWELNQAGNGSATLTVFGKWFSQTNLASYYEGNSREEVTRIFKDVLTVTPEMVSGTKMIGTFWVK